MFGLLIIAAGVLTFLVIASGNTNNVEKTNGDNASAPTGAGQDAGAYNHPYTQDDIIYKDGRYYENENSEDWEEFEYEISEDERFK